jgi:hypothetical protein
MTSEPQMDSSPDARMGDTESKVRAIPRIEGVEYYDDWTDLHGRVDRLLHDAERAKGGSGFAAMMRDSQSAAELNAKYQSLLAEANRVDPSHAAPAWSEADV